MITETGIIIARFQVPELHVAHRYLIDKVMIAHGNNVAIFLGVSAYAFSKKDPLTFEMRRDMVLEHYPYAIVKPIADKPITMHGQRVLMPLYWTPPALHQTQFFMAQGTHSSAITMDSLILR
jgi:hypothetical protein